MTSKAETAARQHNSATGYTPLCTSSKQVSTTAGHQLHASFVNKITQLKVTKDSY
jgi:hypothetical protein